MESSLCLRPKGSRHKLDSIIILNNTNRKRLENDFKIFKIKRFKVSSRDPEMSMSKRLISEIRIIEEEMKSGALRDMIFYHYNESDLSKGEFIIFGTEGTPYEGGIFHFTIEMSQTGDKRFPICPPSIKFTTHTKDYRMHPNLYANGHICLSVLNTWGTPEWAAAMVVLTVITTIQSFCFTETPYRNEPSHEGTPVDYPHLIAYNNFIRCVTFSIIIPYQMSSSVLDKSPFKDQIIAHYRKSRHTYTPILANIEKLHGQTIVSKLYSQSLVVDWPNIKTKIDDIDKRFL